jgi:exodeoxyribonuclease V alpha subunit
LRSDARVVFLGDPDQLASIDAGAVLADMVAGPATGQPSAVLAAAVEPDLIASDNATAAGDWAATERRLDGVELQALGAGRVRLTRGRRYDRDIGDLADAIREGDADQTVTLLERGGQHVSWCQPEDLAQLRTEVVASGVALVDAARDGRIEDALAALGSHRLLCAHREGPHGVRWWGGLAREWVTGNSAQGDDGGWYPGQPLLITGNDYDVGLYNGDTGVVVNAADRGAVAAFERATRPVVIPVTRLSAVATAYAMTVHRSQGSQYLSVSVVLPPPTSRLLTRQLLYTAVTRAQSHVRVIGTEQSVRVAVKRQLMRASGLRHVIESVT